MASNYIILSSKAWNIDLVERLKLDAPESNWHYISRKEDFNLEVLEKIKPEKIFIPHWSYIIPESIFINFDCVVFHMTDLPYGRGGSPLQNLIANGLEHTKISAIKVVKELDAGPIYLKSELGLYGTAEEIFIRANHIIYNMIIKIKNESPILSEQEGKITTFKRRTPKMSSIEDLKELEDIFNHIRMLDADGYPHAYLETERLKLEFTRASLKADKSIIADVRITKK
ncbi:methionyl-tRNA formyltransferase [Maribacter polysaccharolyticus]|uniref:methionyl-tRNA formyltransferase n=1 Tax=Maribacter polysaccharolyticus TaxID=3020831 RepID=UPI00237FB780|nr:methionyl-tRNA formyltransferase [Maribacter polysaccharolyticus]MDE3742218.1 methionyl-tRNA formyltransferase [Maribacter polysaccharolyticus]